MRRLKLIIVFIVVCFNPPSLAISDNILQALMRLDDNESYKLVQKHILTASFDDLQFFDTVFQKVKVALDN